MRLIDADFLKNIHGMKDDCAECDKELRHKSRSCEFDRVYTLMDFCGWIDDAPTIELKKEKIAYLVNPNPYGECSECGQLIDSRDGFNFCPNCGARLEEGESG